MSNSEPEATHSTTLDSDAQEVGDLYGQALLGAAGDQADSVLEELNAIVKECLEAHPSLEAMLTSPRVSQEEKESALDRIFNGKISSTLLNFLKVLCRRGRIEHIRAIHATAGTLRDEQLGRIRILVTSAQPLNDEQRASIDARMRAALGKDVSMEERVDESLLGGVVIRVGDQVYDGSVVGKMSSIRSVLSSGIQKAIRDKYESLLTN